MSEKGTFVWNPKTKTFERGKASPELLPEHMRALPSDYTTREIADPKRVHRLDEPHIVRNLVKEQKQREQGHLSPEEKQEQEEKRYPSFQEQAKMPVRQADVNAIIMRVIRARVDGIKLKCENGEDPTPEDFAIKHVWFPQNALIPRQLRDGNPPADVDRPKHLRGLDLVVDIFNWPRDIRAKLESMGVRQLTRKDLERWQFKAKQLADDSVQRDVQKEFLSRARMR